MVPAAAFPRAAFAHIGVVTSACDAADAHLVELPVERAVGCEVLGQEHGVDLAFPVRYLEAAERLARAQLDVLPVEEHHHAVRHLLCR